MSVRLSFMFDFHKCLPSALPQKHSRRWLLMPTSFFHRGDAQSVSHWRLFEERFCVSHCSETLLFQSCAQQCCYIWPERLKIVESSSWYIRILPSSWKSAWLCKMLKCCVSLGIALTSNSFGDGYWVFSPYSLAKAPNLEARTLVNPKARGVKCLCFDEVMDTVLMVTSVSLQPPQLSDAVISMVTQTPRLSTAACEEQHSAAQGSHDQVSQKESPKRAHLWCATSSPVRFFLGKVTQAVRSVHICDDVLLPGLSLKAVAVQLSWTEAFDKKSTFVQGWFLRYRLKKQNKGSTVQFFEWLWC